MHSRTTLMIFAWTKLAAGAIIIVKQMVDSKLLTKKGACTKYDCMLTFAHIAGI
jgi:hypothetical protein